MVRAPTRFNIFPFKTRFRSTFSPETPEKKGPIRQQLKHPLIKEIRGKGLMLALILESFEIANKIVLEAKENQLILFWLLYEPKAVRISPPLTISEEELAKGCAIILDILESI